MTDDWLGIPPGRSFLVLPRRPSRAAINGLSLYDAVDRHQYVLAAGVRMAVRVGLVAPLKLRSAGQLPEPGWWAEWLASVAKPVIGEVAHSAFRLLGPFPRAGTTALLMDAAGEPMAFAKVKPPDSFSSMTPGVTERLGDAPGTSFRAPRLLATGHHDGHDYYLHEPFPDARHRHFPDRPDRLGAIVDEFQQRLSDLVPSNAAPGTVVVHRSMAPYNLRVDREGTPWLFDFDKVDIGPRLGDELYFWLRRFDRRTRSMPRKARAIASRLLQRGDEDEIVEAVRWHEGVRPRGAEPSIDALRQAILDRLSRRST